MFKQRVIFMLIALKAIDCSEVGEGPGDNDGEAHANTADNSGEELGGVKVENCVGAVGGKPGSFLSFKLLNKQCSLEFF